MDDSIIFVVSEALDYFHENTFLVLFLGLLAFVIGIEGMSQVVYIVRNVSITLV